MYNKEYQNNTKIQFKGSAVTMLGQEYAQIFEDNILGHFIKDDRQQRLYLEIMEALVRKNDIISDVILYRNQGQQGSQMEQQYVDQNQNQQHEDRSSIIARKSLKQQNPPLPPQQKKQQRTNNPIKNPYSITSHHLHKILDIIIQHCDREGKTKNIHKILYLIVKYFQMKYNCMNSGSKKQVRTTKDRISTGDLIQWLTHSQRLFQQQLAQPPIKDKIANILATSTRNIKKISQSFKQKITQISTAATSNTSATPPKASTYLQLGKNNKYTFLLASLNQYQLEVLLVQLEELVVYVISKFQSYLLDHDNDTNYDLLKLATMHDKLVKRLGWLIQIVTKQIYMQQQLLTKLKRVPKMQPKNPSQRLQQPPKDTRFYRSKIQYQFINSIKDKYFKKYQNQYPTIFGQQNLNIKNLTKDDLPLPQEIVEMYEQVTTVLRYMLSILLGNRDVIRVYAANNIYLFLKLYIFYIHSLEFAADGRINPDSEFNPGLCLQLVTRHLQKLHNIRVSQIEQYYAQDEQYIPIKSEKPKTSISRVHNLLLQLISHPAVPFLPLATLANQQRQVGGIKKHPLLRDHPQFHYHKIIQQILYIFKGYQFYGYLLSTIIFNMGFVDKEIYILDQQYETNMIQQLLVCAASKVKAQIYEANTQNNKQVNKQIRQQPIQQQKQNIQNNYVPQNSNSMERVGSLFYNQDQNQMIQEQDQFQHSQQYMNMQNMQQHNAQVPFQSSIPSIKKQVRNVPNRALKNRNNSEGQVLRQKQLQRQRLIQIQKQKQREEQKLKIREQTPTQKMQQTRIKLLLCTISYYKNVLFKTNRYKQLYLKYKMSLQAQEFTTYSKKKDRASINQNKQQVTPIIDVMYTGLPLHQLIDSLLAQNLPFQYFNTFHKVNQLRNICRYACQVDLQEYYGRYMRNLLAYNIGDIDQIQNENLTQKIINRFDLQLLILDIQNSAWAEKSHFIYNNLNKINASPMNRFFAYEQQIQYELYHPDNLFLKNVDSKYSHQFYNSYAYHFIHSQFLTSCTLVEPFPYQLLQKVRDFTDDNSNNQIDAYKQEFRRAFQIYIILECLTSRGKYKPHSIIQGKLAQKQQKNGETIMKGFQSNKIKKLTGYHYHLPFIQDRLDAMIKILQTRSMQGCGQVLRVTWQIFEDYQDIRIQAAKMFSHSEEEEQILSKMSERLMWLVGQLREYLQYMQSHGYFGQIYYKLRQMIL